MSISTKKIMLIGAIAPPLGNRISLGCLPFGAMALSAYLKQKGANCKVISTALPNAVEEISSGLKDADLVGISSMSGPYLSYAISVAQNIRKIRPQLPIVWGGPHASLLEGELIINNLADYVIKGVGERSLLSLVDAIDKPGNIPAIPGLIWKDEGIIRKNNPDTSFDINELPQLDYSLVSARYPFLLTNEFSYFSSRGCPFNCSYCVASLLYNRCWYDKSEDKVVNELEEAYKTFNFKSVFFWDDNLFIDIKRLNNILSRLDHSGIHFEWSGFCRADLFSKFSDSTITDFKRLGLKWVSIGAESGSQKILDMLDKGITIDHIRQTAVKIRKWDISCDFSFMGGIPLESAEDFQKTLDLTRWIKSVNPSASVRIFRFIPYPKMPILDSNKEISRFLPQNSYDWSQTTYQNTSFPWVPKNMRDSLATVSTISLYSQRPSGLSFKNIILSILYYVSQFRFKTGIFHLPFESFVIDRVQKFFCLRALKRFNVEFRRAIF